VEPAAPSPRRPVGIAVLAVGGAGLVAGVITGAMAIGKHSDLQSACPGGTCVGQSDALSSYQTFGTVADVGIIAGGALPVTRTILVATAPKQAASQRARVTPIVGPGFAGARGSF